MTSPITVDSVRILGQGPVVDLDVASGRIVAIRPAHSQGPARVLLPGFVDLHTHLREPGGEASETIESGTAAAAAGGFTDVFAMANTSPVTDTVALVEQMRSRAVDASARVHPNSAATIGLAGSELVDVAAMLGAGVSVFSDDGHCVSDDGVAYRLFQAIAGTDALFAQHAQSPGIVGHGVINERVADQAGCEGWPAVGEEAIVARDLALAVATGGRLHVCHVSTAGTVELVRWAKSRGIRVTAEVTPHHLSLSDDDAVAAGPALKVNPPLRSPDDIAALRAALVDGTIDVVATDHAPHPAETKSRPWPTAAFGLTAIETALPIVAEVVTGAAGEVDWVRLARVLGSAPAEIGGIAAIAGRTPDVGGPATFCVVEDAAWTVDPAAQRSLSRNTPFAGRAMQHRVALTMLEGKVTHAN